MTKKINRGGMTAVGKSILDGLEEVLKHARGEKADITVYDMRDYKTQPAEDQAKSLLQDIRGELDMNRAEFAEAFSFNKYSIRNWETGERRPPKYCLAYLQLIASNPKKAYNQLHGKRAA